MPEATLRNRTYQNLSKTRQMQQDLKNFSINQYNSLQLNETLPRSIRGRRRSRFAARWGRYIMRASIRPSMISRFAVAVAAIWMYGAGSAWAGGGGESLTSLQAVIGPPDGSSGFCNMLSMGTSFNNGTTCPQLPTFTQAILEAAGLEQSPPEMVGAQNGLPPGSNLYASNPAALFTTPYPLSAFTSTTLSALLSNLTPLAFISSQKGQPTPAPVQLQDANANTFLYAVTVSSQHADIAPGGTVPDYLYLFYDDLSDTTQNVKSGQIVAKFSLPLTVLNSSGTENLPTIVTLQIMGTCNGGPLSCLQAQVISGFGASPSTPSTWIPATQFGIQFALVFGASPASSQNHGIFALAIPLVVTGACQNPVPPGICLSGQTAPGPNTDPAYFYGLHHPVPNPPPGAPTELPGPVNLGLFTAFGPGGDDLGVTPTQSGILPAGGASIGIAPTAGPLCPIVNGARACPSSFTFALCASLPGGNANGQAPIPSVAAYYAIAVNGEALLSASLSSTSVCPAL
jgi:hypothetical protein